MLRKWEDEADPTLLGVDRVYNAEASLGGRSVLMMSWAVVLPVKFGLDFVHISWGLNLEESIPLIMVHVIKSPFYALDIAEPRGDRNSWTSFMLLFL